MTFHQEENCTALYDESGNRIAEVTSTDCGSYVEIDHTFVDPSLRGQGVADAITRALFERLRAENRKVRATCSYTQRWLVVNHAFDDLLAQ